MPRRGRKKAPLPKNAPIQSRKMRAVLDFVDLPDNEFAHSIGLKTGATIGKWEKSENPVPEWAKKVMAHEFQVPVEYWDNPDQTLEAAMAAHQPRTDVVAEASPVYQQLSPENKALCGKFIQLLADSDSSFQRMFTVLVEEGERQAAEREANTTVAQYFGDWMTNHAEVNCRPSTVSNFRSAWKLYLAPAVGQKKLNEVTRDDVAVLVTSMATAPSRLRLTCMGTWCQAVISRKWKRWDSRLPCQHPNLSAFIRVFSPISFRHGSDCSDSRP